MCSDRQFHGECKDAVAVGDAIGHSITNGAQEQRIHNARAELKNLYALTSDALSAVANILYTLSMMPSMPCRFLDPHMVPLGANLRELKLLQVGIEDAQEALDLAEQRLRPQPHNLPKPLSECQDAPPQESRDSQHAEVPTAPGAERQPPSAEAIVVNANEQKSMPAGPRPFWFAPTD